MSDEKTVTTSLVRAQNIFLQMVEDQFIQRRIVIDPYQKTCALNAIAAIGEVLKVKQITFSDPGLDKSSLSAIMQTVTALRLNAGAQPREVYFQLRSKKHGSGQTETWTQEIEMGIEGNGNDALLRNFGVNIDIVSNPWLVRAEDGFDYPEFNGMDVTPPRWRPTGRGDVVRIVYCVKLKTGSVEYLIQERADVKPNLLAHIANNIMNETFGFAESRYKATPEQKNKIADKKAVIMELANSMELEEILDSTDLSEYISPAWKEGQSREQMLIRKMRNNAVKKYPKDFGNMFTATQYASIDETYKEVQEEVSDNADNQTLDVEQKKIPEVIKPITTPKTHPKAAKKAEVEEAEKIEEVVKIKNPAYPEDYFSPDELEQLSLQDPGF